MLDWNFDASPLRGWLKCNHTLIGELHSFDHLEKAPYSFKNNDGSNCDIKYFGGLNIGVRFMNEASRNAFMNEWTEWFSKVDSGDIATTNFDRIAWIKISGLPLELWSEENFTVIAESLGRVIVSFVVDPSAVNLSFGKVGILTEYPSSISREPFVEVNGKIIKIRISEVDFDWVPFKSKTENFSSDDEEDEDADEDDEEEYISDTVPMDDNDVGLEEGEFRISEVDVVKESSMGSSESNPPIDSRSPEVMSSPVDGAINEDDRGNGNDIRGDCQKSVIGMEEHGNSQREVESLNNNERSKNNNESNNDVVHAALLSHNVENNNVGPNNRMVNGLPYNLDISGCFGPFPNNLGLIENQTDVNFDSAHDKRRRTVRNTEGTPVDVLDFPPPQPNIDLNCMSIPSQILLPDSNTDSPSPSMEIRNTVVIGNMLGFDVDEENPMLKEVFGEADENNTFR
ncbi:unnamed protein product [Lactuca virosa]|uniref:DUF4283 domain-containing protein n=1 Tax=Lactuca virosa TaxID=75947 RepID=A0AAU9NWH4_9ASTR|nr:unnamed protein product [Lactuca virosa]